MKEKTLIIIKPDGVKKHLVGECMRRFEKKGFSIVALKITELKKPFMQKFYYHLKQKLKPRLFNAIINYMCSGNVVIAILERKNAVALARKMCGPTNPKEAPKGTIRGDFATDDLVIRAKQNKATRNIIHASASKKEAEREIRLIKKLL
ncbi:MAG: nucleoside-diphosphate kinase [Candidatus Pacearchaeota archaeon]|nr:nucleoside-diphosphate kinase [Candidatus Pacearchaeota archaeon]